MIEFLMNMDIKSYFILIFAAIIIVFIMLSICRIAANKYVIKNRQELFDEARPLSDKCAKTGIRLLNELQTFRKYIHEMGLCQTYSCSSSIEANAANNPIKYLIKYSNIKYDENNLEKIDYCIKWSRLYRQNITDMTTLTNNIRNNLPPFIKLFTSRKKLSYNVCNISYDLAKFEDPVFIFSYVSTAGRSGRLVEIYITPAVLLNIRSEVYAKLNKQAHSKTQRATMTNDLREAIKKRDNYTCCICGNSVYKEPNLLLEVDHIIPISKGGKTEASNLQTLCWRCNRAKSNKM